MILAVIVISLAITVYREITLRHLKLAWLWKAWALEVKVWVQAIGVQGTSGR